jgi:hypothetical protein
MEPKDIISSEIRIDRKTNTTCTSSYAELKIVDFIKVKIE